MTDQSRVEAVARAMCHADGIRFDDLGRVGWDYWLKLAKAAIEANDAWLKENGGGPSIVEVECAKCTATGVRRDDLAHSDYWMHCSVCGGPMKISGEPDK